LVWQDIEIGNFVNSRFIPLRFTPADEDYRQIRTNYKVRGTPTVLLLNPQGEEIDRTLGFDGKRDEYFQTIQDFSAGKDTLLSLLAKLDENPDDVETNVKIGNRFIDRNEWENVQPYFAKVLEMDPDDAKGFKSESTYNLAVYELRVNSKIEHLQNFIATCTDQERLYQSYGNLATHFIQTEKPEKASELYEEALEKLPENANLLTDYAMFVFTSKIEDKYEKGFERAKKAMALAPDNEEVLFSSYYSLISYYKAMENQDKYFETYEEVIRKMPKETFFMYGYAEAILKAKSEDKYNRGIEIAKKALELEPQAAHIWHSLGRLYFENGELKNAVEAVKKAVEINPGSKIYKETLEKFEEEKKEDE
jgi:tetratricopeptide (TPR) repeat protein